MSSPSLVPEYVPAEVPLYFVMVDYGPKIGRAYVETDPEVSGREDIVRAIAESQFTGQHSWIAKVLEVNEAAGTARDVTEEILTDANQFGTTHA